MEKNLKNKKESEDCIFCKIVKKQVKADIISDEENFIVMKDINQDYPGHCLIIPKTHYETIFDMPSTLATELIGIIKKQSLRLIKEKKADGIKLINNNYEAAGQVVKHLHVHIVPFKKGDNSNIS